MKIGSHHPSVSALAYSANRAPLSEQGEDDDAAGRGRRLPGDTPMTGLQTVAAPALSQALWDMIAGKSGETPALSPDTADQVKARDGLYDDLHTWATMSIAEKIRAQYLDSKGLSESDLAAMPPQDRQAIEDEIGKAVKQALGIDEQASGDVDKTDATQAA